MSGFDLDGFLLGESLVMQRLRALIARVAPSRLPVLIEGPTGAGKELVAKALHICSGRPGDLVAFNVCAIADTMFEDALFGHVRGAFTGAVSDSQGYLAQANHGTAFFDEISGLPLGAQAKLLRAIETQEFRPVGGRRDVKSDFRLVAATAVELEGLCASGQFRDDLRHRFGKLVLRVPALSERREDIPLLVAHYLRQFGGDTTTVSARALERMRQDEWAGNVRELRAVVETLAVLRPSDHVDLEDLAGLLGARRTAVLHDFETARTVSALRASNGDVYAAARKLGVNPTTVYRRLRRARLSPSQLGAQRAAVS